MVKHREYRNAVYNSSTHLIVGNAGWFRGRCKTVKLAGFSGYEIEVGSKEYIYELDTNFFSTELMELDPTNTEELACFIGNYGLPLAPYNRMTESYINDCEETDYTGIEATEKMRQSVVDSHSQEANKRRDATGEKRSPLLELQMLYTTNSHPDLIISHKEALYTITSLKEVVKTIFSVLESDTEKHAINPNVFAFINSASFSNEVVWVDWSERPVQHAYGFTSAVASQIRDTIKDDAGWYKCEAEDCNRWFKHSRGKKGRKRSNTGSKYCCLRCGNRQRKRNLRKDTSSKKRSNKW